MANSKKCCRFCKEYKYTEDMIKLPSGHACDMDCVQGIISKDRDKKREQAKKQQEWQKKQDKKIDLKVKKMKKEHNANNRSLRTKGAKDAFNAFIRKRDENLSCISCGSDQTTVTYLRGGYWDCGHYLTVGAHPELRFTEDNAHKQCKSCNGGAGKYAKKNHTVSKEYRINLIKKIGSERVEWLEGPHKANNYSCADLKDIELHYKKKLKRLNK